MYTAIFSRIFIKDLGFDTNIFIFKLFILMKEKLCSLHMQRFPIPESFSDGEASWMCF